MLSCIFVHLYGLGRAQRTNGTNAYPAEGINQPPLSERQNIRMRTQWRELAIYMV